MVRCAVLEMENDVNGRITASVAFTWMDRKAPMVFCAPWVMDPVGFTGRDDSCVWGYDRGNGGVGWV